MAEMLLAKDHNVIEAVPADRSSRNRAIPYAHRREAPNESLAIGPIAIANNITAARSAAFRRRSFAPIARCDISSALNGAPASQRRPGSEDPEDVAQATCAATWKSPNSRDTIAFPGAPPLQPNDPHGRLRRAR
jgi:hypothetical protein